MTSIKSRQSRKLLAVAILALAAGSGFSTVASARLTLTPPPARLAQATPPLQSTPGSENRPEAPADSGTTGQRPQATPPQPARPEADAKDAKPALPPAPAEKTAPPIQQK